MKISIISALALILISLTSCHQLTTTIGNYNLPTTVNKNPTKRGESCAYYTIPFSYFYSDNDLTVEKARNSANISEIISVEMKNTFVYPLHYNRCVIVRGN